MSKIPQLSDRTQVTGLSDAVLAEIDADACAWTDDWAEWQPVEPSKQEANAMFIRRAVELIEQRLGSTPSPAPALTAGDELIWQQWLVFKNSACLPTGDRFFESFRKAALALLGARAGNAQAEAIPMVLYCPNCGKQHIDAPEPREVCATSEWTNPPHRSHLCHECGAIWRPADVPTVGVASTETEGKADTWPNGLPDDALAANAQTASALTDDQIRTIEEASTKLENIGHIFAGDKQSRRLAKELSALLAPSINGVRCG